MRPGLIIVSALVAVSGLLVIVLSFWAARAAKGATANATGLLACVDQDLPGGQGTFLHAGMVCSDETARTPNFSAPILDA